MSLVQPSQDFSPVKVYGLLFIGLTAFSFAPVLVRYAVEYSGILVAAVRTVIAFVLLIPVYLISQKKIIKDSEEPTKDHLLVAVAGLALGLHFIAWISSLYYTSISSASVLVCIHPIILIIAERTLMKMSFKPIVWAGVIISFIGTVLLGYFDMSGENIFPQAGLGNALAILAAIIFAVYFLIGRKVRQKRNWIGYVFPVYGYAALMCVVFLFIKEGIPEQLDTKILLIGTGLAIGPQLFGHGSLNYAVKYVSATVLSTSILVEPILASILAFLLFQELPMMPSILAMMIILAGIGLTWKRKRRVLNSGN